MEDLNQFIEWMRDRSPGKDPGRYHSLLSMAYLHTARHEEGLAEARQALDHDPDAVNSHLLVAKSHLDHQEYRQAEAASRQALQLDSGHVLANCALGFSLVGQDRLPEAIAAYQAALNSIPNLSLFISSSRGCWAGGAGPCHRVAAIRLGIKPPRSRLATNAGRHCFHQRDYEAAF